MTLGNMRSLGVRLLAVSCTLCHHAAVLSAEPWPDHIPVPTFDPRMACTVCGIIGADGDTIAKLSMPAEAAAALRVSERMLLFCVASGTDWKHPAIPGEIVTTTVVKGLIDRDGWRSTLPHRSRARRAPGNAAGAVMPSPRSAVRQIARNERAHIISSAGRGEFLGGRIVPFRPGLSLNGHISVLAWKWEEGKHD
jgi:hypothetical protein